MTGPIGRRGLVAAALALSEPAAAQAPGSRQVDDARPAKLEEYYPTRPVTLVVAWAPGGSTDFVARVVAQQLSKELNGNVVVDNRPGASGTVGHASVARARPDGHTLLLGVNSTYAMARHLFPQRGYDDDKAFASAGRLAVSPIFLCVNPKLGANDIQGLIAKAKAQPGKLSYGSSGAGSSAHLATELFLRSAGIDVQNVTYRGGAPALTAVAGGEVDLTITGATQAQPFAVRGQMRPIAVTGPRRSPLLPSGRMRPAFIISPAEAMLWKPPWICPASMSWSIGVSPR